MLANPYKQQAGRTRDVLGAHTGRRELPFKGSLAGWVFAGSRGPKVFPKAAAVSFRVALHGAETALPQGQVSSRQGSSKDLSRAAPARAETPVRKKINSCRTM